MIKLHGSKDLSPLIEDIDTSRVVMLGEASHGTHEYYTWRTAISKMLIQEKDFRFIAVEGDWPDCYKINRYVKGYKDAGRMKTNVVFLKVPVASVKVYYKNPNRLKIKNEKGISFIPKGAVSINMTNVLSGNSFTAGLSGVRTSPDHGTAFDIAGKNRADESSFRAAVFSCVEIINQRKAFEENRKNPLRKLGAAVIANVEDEKIEE